MIKKSVIKNLSKCVTKQDTLIDSPWLSGTGACWTLALVGHDCRGWRISCAIRSPLVFTVFKSLFFPLPSFYLSLYHFFSLLLTWPSPPVSSGGEGISCSFVFHKYVTHQAVFQPVSPRSLHELADVILTVLLCYIAINSAWLPGGAVLTYVNQIKANMGSALKPNKGPSMDRIPWFLRFNYVYQWCTKGCALVLDDSHWNIVQWVLNWMCDCVHLPPAQTFLQSQLKSYVFLCKV